MKDFQGSTESVQRSHVTGIRHPGLVWQIWDVAEMDCTTATEQTDSTAEGWPGKGKVGSL